MNDKTVLVTGGAGYFGSVLIGSLLKSSYGVLCLDNLKFGSDSISFFRNFGEFNFIEGDINDYPLVSQILSRKGINAVVHLASIVGDPACKEQPELAKKVNYHASVYLIEKSIENKIKRFIFASTCSNYGKKEGLIDENSKLSPLSLYAELKVKIEDYISLRGNLNPKVSKDWCPTVLRFATAYGMSYRMRFDLTVNEFVKDLFLGKTLQIYGEKFWRPYCHVRDIAEAVILALESPEEKVAHKVFNVGDTRENYTKWMIVEEILRLIPEGKIEVVPKDEDPRDYKVNFDKIKNELGFWTTWRVREGISEMWKALERGLFSNTEDPRYYNSRKE